MDGEEAMTKIDMKLPLNDDGSIASKSFQTCFKGIAIYGVTPKDSRVDYEYYDLDNLIKAIEQHTIERCAKVAEPCKGELISDWSCGYWEGQKDAAEKIRELGENNEEETSI